MERYRNPRKRQNVKANVRFTFKDQIIPATHEIIMISSSLFHSNTNLSSDEMYSIDISESIHGCENGTSITKLYRRILLLLDSVQTPHVATAFVKSEDRSAMKLPPDQIK